MANWMQWLTTVTMDMEKIETKKYFKCQDGIVCF